MIYPAKLDITILQNSTFKAVFRALQKQQAITAFTVTSGNPIFTVPCHGLIAGDKVVIVPPGDAEATLPAPTTPEAPDVPCGLTLNQVYFVSATGLTSSAFTVSATNGGAASRAVHKACVQCTCSVHTDTSRASTAHCCLCLCLNACRVSGDQRDTRLTLGPLRGVLSAAR